MRRKESREVANMSEDELTQMLYANPDLARRNYIVPEAPQGQRKGFPLLAGSLLPTVPVKPSKYNVAKKADRYYAGVLYASLKEKRFAEELDLRQRAGEITFWLRQIPIGLPGGVRYFLDFVTFTLLTGYEPGAWEIHWIEVKGRDLELGRAKRKIAQSIYGICIEVV